VTPALPSARAFLFSYGCEMDARVIIADDEAIIRMGLRAMLEDAGYQVVGEASTADEVFELLPEQEADVVLLDVKMPGMDTLQAARLLKKDHGLPVVLVTAFSDRDLLRQAGEAGALGYVVKPVREDQLLAAIAVAMARGADLRQLTEALETRKLAERAKGVLMKRLGIGEEEAHLLLHRRARDQRKSVREVAYGILSAATPAETESVQTTARPPNACGPKK